MGEVVLWWLFQQTVQRCFFFKGWTPGTPSGRGGTPKFPARGFGQFRLFLAYGSIGGSILGPNRIDPPTRPKSEAGGCLWMGGGRPPRPLEQPTLMGTMPSVRQSKEGKNSCILQNE